MPIKSFRELFVWQRSMELAKAIYKLTSSFPKDEMYGITSQMRRAAVSIPSNIAEGKARKTAKDLMQFLHIANGSLAELLTQVLLAKSLYPSKEYENIERLIEEVSKMLTGLMMSLRK